MKCGKGGRVSSDSDCLNWKSLGICSHCVVGAETNNCLPDFVESPSITQLVLTGVSSGIGSKGNHVSRIQKKRDYQSCSDVLTHISCH